MDFVPGNELLELCTQPIIRVRGNVVEFIHSDQAIIKRLDTQLFIGKTSK